MPRGTDPGRDVLADRVGEVGVRVSAVEARVEDHEQRLDRFRSDVRDAQMTSHAVLETLRDIVALRDTVVDVRIAQASIATRTNIVMGVLGVVGAAAVAAVVKYLAG